MTGATACALVCYVIPVLVHLRLYFRGWRHRGANRGGGGCCGGGEARRWLLDPGHGGGSSGAEPRPRPASPALAGAAAAAPWAVPGGAQSDVSLDTWLRLSHEAGGGSPTSSAALGSGPPTPMAAGSVESLPELPGRLLGPAPEGTAAGLAPSGLRGRKAGAGAGPCGYPSWRSGCGRGPAGRAWLALRHVVLPVVVVVTGVGFSFSALLLAVASWRAPSSSSSSGGSAY